MPKLELVRDKTDTALRLLAGLLIWTGIVTMGGGFLVLLVTLFRHGR